jgi:predicted ArsR family transcriptional regulator
MPVRLQLPNMTNLTIKVIRALRGSSGGPCTVTQLCERTGGSDQAIRLLLGRLIAAGWVVREPFPRREAVTDPRYLFRLTERGEVEAGRALDASGVRTAGERGERL